MTGKGPLNYTTKVPVSKSTGECLDLLAQAGADSLALAAATALGYDHIPTKDYETWLAAAGTPPQDGAS